jgi:hypothetical protein
MATTPAPKLPAIGTPIQVLLPQADGGPTPQAGLVTGHADQTAFPGCVTAVVFNEAGQSGGWNLPPDQYRAVP